MELMLLEIYRDHLSVIEDAVEQARSKILASLNTDHRLHLCNEALRRVADDLIAGHTNHDPVRRFGDALAIELGNGNTLFVHDLALSGKSGAWYVEVSP